MPISATRGVLTSVDMEGWQEHRFGLPPDRWNSLSGHNFWITGAGTGFGRAMAHGLAAAGARVFLTGRRPEYLEVARRESSAFGVPEERYMPLPADVRDASSMAKAVDEIARSAPQLDGLINNAALSNPAAGPWPLSDLDVGRWQNLFDTNLMGPWLATQAALPLLARGEAPRVLFVTSEAGWADTSGFGPYNVSKSALNSLTMSWAREFATRFPDKDVQVNGLIPGEAKTEMNQGSIESPFSVVSMMLILLSHPAPGPNGRFFHRDGRHFAFAYADAHGTSLL